MDLGSTACECLRLDYTTYFELSDPLFITPSVHKKIEQFVYGTSFNIKLVK